MEINNKRKLLKAPPNLTLGNKKDELNNKNGVSSCNLSRIADKTQRTQFKQQQSILHDLAPFLNTKRQQSPNQDNQNDSSNADLQNDSQDYNPPDPKHQLQLEKIYQEYQRALQILTTHSDSKKSPAYSFLKAYQILNSLILTIKTQKHPDLKYELAQNILLNYWKVGNDLFMSQPSDKYEEQPKNKNKKLTIQQKERQKIVQNFKEVFPVLEEMILKQPAKSNQLTVLALIMAKEYFRDKDMGKALEWCENGFKHCPKFKNTSILLKLHYMKSKIYAEIRANQPEYEQIKKCIFFLKALSQSTTENKEFSHQLMKTLIKRRQELKTILEGALSSQGYKFQYNKSTQKTSSNASNLQKSVSLNKFRKRSISFTKLQNLNQDPLDKQNPNAFNINIKKSLHKDIPQTAYNTINNQNKKEFLKLDITRKTKLKKKGQTLTIWEKNSQKITFQNKIAKQLQKASITSKNTQNDNRFRDLMLRRPNQIRTLNFEGSEYPQKGAKFNDMDQEEEESKQKNHYRNQLNNSASNAPKTQTLKEQSNHPEHNESPQKQSITQNTMKNRIVITTKSDNQLIKYISTIQNDFLTKYFAKGMKTSTNEAGQDHDGDYLGDQFMHQMDLAGQLMNKDSHNKEETNMSKIKAKATHDFQDYPIESDSNNSGNSYTRNVVVPEQDDEDKMIFPNLVSKEEKKNSIITLYGVIDQIHLEVRRRKTTQSGRRQKSPQTDGFKFSITTIINNQIHKAELNFPLSADPLLEEPQITSQAFQEEFHIWMYDSVHQSDHRMAKSMKGIENAGMIQSMLKRQSIDAGIDTFLIEKILSSICMKRNSNFGYLSLGQKNSEMQFDSDEEWERENIFQWREKNFQYLKDYGVNGMASSSNHLTLDWKIKSTTSNRSVVKRENQEMNDEMSSFELFFIELEKISSPKSVNESTPLQYLLSRYNTTDVGSFEKQFVHSYVLYNQKKKWEKIKEMEREREIEEGESFADVSGMSEEESLNVLNFSQNVEHQTLSFDDKIVAKVEFMRNASMRICKSFFPKSKYLQLTSQKQSFSVKYTNQKWGEDEVKLAVQGRGPGKNEEFVIKIIGCQSTEQNNRKKVSVRKSQIIQLQQNLNHSNFLRDVLKSKSSFQVEKREVAQKKIELGYKKSQFMINTMGKMSSDEKESAKMSVGSSWVGGSGSSKVEGSKMEELSKSTKRKSLEGEEKSKISKSTMVRILKKALIQPDYTKSTLLMTYFDSLSIKSFFKLMGTHPNYIKLTCFRLKSIYVEDEQSLSYYYLFELQEREARTRMHKFIIGDKEIVRLIQEQRFDWMSEKSELETRLEDKENIGGNWILHRGVTHTKTLPHKKKVQITHMESNDEVLSDENKPPYGGAQSVTSSRLKSKRSIFQPLFAKAPSVLPMSLVNFLPEFQLKFTEESLTQVMKLITPHIVIKKDYLYTSVCIDSNDKTFYLMNKFTVENDSLTEGSPQNNISEEPLGEAPEIQQEKSQAFRHSEDLYKSNISKQNEKNFFLSEQIKAKKILCQKSIVLEVTQSFLKTLKPTPKERRSTNSNVSKENSIFVKESRENSKSKQYQVVNKKRESLFAILTIIKISKSNYFTIKLYIPKFQRSYTLTLDKSLMSYLELKDLKHIFGQVEQACQILKQLETVWELDMNRENEGELLNVQQNGEYINLIKKKHHLLQRLSQMLFEQNPQNQKIYWKNLLSLIQIQQKFTEDKVYLIMKISHFHGFIKDSSFLQFFQKDHKMYMIEMTINKKSSNSQYFPKHQYLESLPGTKIKRGLLTQKNHKHKLIKTPHSKAQPANPSNLISAQSINCHNQQFVKMSSIYESKAQAYTLYVQIFKIFEEGTQNKRDRLLTGKLTAGKSTPKMTQKPVQDGIDSELIGPNDSVNQIVHQSVNMSERQSEVSFPELKSNHRLIRTNTFHNTLKSTLKSIHSQNNLKPTPQACFSRPNRLKSNYKLMNHNNQPAQESNEISKINFSFYLNELNVLFKYIDENYSDEFNEEYFLLAQMSTAFKMLGTIIVEEFKAVKQESANKLAQITKRSTQKKVTLIRRRPEDSEAVNKFKRSVTRKGTSRISGAQSLLDKQVGFENQLQTKEGEKEQEGSPLPSPTSSPQRQSVREPIKKSGKQQYTVEELFCQQENQKHFKEKILGRMREYKDKIDTLVLEDGIKEDNASNVSSKVNESVEKSAQGVQSAQLSQNAQLSQTSESAQGFQGAQRAKVSQDVNKSSVATQDLSQKFISLHSRCSKKGFVDLHILTSEREHKVSTLFYSYKSLLFLISNTKSFQIFMMSIKVEEEHPFSFIQVLEEKHQLSCIRNRLFKFYRNLLTLMAK